jgi:orotidine-5'-phosphate decarboxylase
MGKFISSMKMSKKTKREFDTSRRNTWGMISPVTRRTESKKVQQERNNSSFVEPSIFALSCKGQTTATKLLRYFSFFKNKIFSFT